MKRSFIALAAFISIIVCSVSAVHAKEKSTSNASVIQVSVKGVNVKFERGRSDTIETEYYGTASESNYNLSAVKDGNTYKITLKRKGNGMAPTINEGGLSVKMPDDIFYLLHINGKRGSGIVIDDIKADVQLVTESCAVVINNKNSSNKIGIHSKHDSYAINSVPISRKFQLHSDGSAVEFTFTKQPVNLKFQLTAGYAELPADWSRNFSIGLGRPKMIVNADHGIFQLSVDD